jgi:hypothetical protein
MNGKYNVKLNALYVHSIFFIIQPLHMFRPLKGHPQGDRKLHM